VEDPKPSVFRFGEFEASARDMRLTRNGQELALEPKAFRVLVYLLRNPGRLASKEELLSSVWGDTAVTENSLTRAVALLRKTLDDDTREPRFITTIPTAGYRFIGHVETILADTAVPASAPVVRVPASRGLTGRKTLRISLAAGAVIAFAVLAWYLLRPLSPPRVTAYAQITHDGHIGIIAGTDGSRIYFNRNPWGPVVQVGVSGGDIVTIPTGSMTVSAVGMSADGTSLLIRSFDPDRLWTMGTLGGPPHLVADRSGQANHSWSPDGKLIAYSEFQGRTLFVMRADGTGVHKLATTKGDITDIAWSPDGGRIRLTFDDAIWEITSTGENLHPVLPDWKGPPGQCCGRWTPDGAFYLFLAGGNNYAGPTLGGFEQIWVLDERRGLFRRASHKPVQLTSGPVRWEVPVPSRDGEKIFARGTTPRGELVQFDSKSNEFQPFLGGISAESVSFSRDGSQIAYVTYPDGILWRAKVDGTERVELTSPPLYPELCRWSPDGTQILFTAKRSVSRYAIYTVAAQGGNPQPLIPVDDGMGQVDGNLVARWAAGRVSRRSACGVHPRYRYRASD
jgi:DNA-binding winged helix-turn-helix (wHTH) protein